MSAALLLAAATTVLRPELAPLEFLAGHCWRGGSDTHCFERVYGGMHLRDRHKVEDYEGETLYSWNAKAQRIEWVYWNSLGDVLTGDTAAAKDGLSFNGGALHWRRVGDRAYEVRQTGRTPQRFERID